MRDSPQSAPSKLLFLLLMADFAFIIFHLLYTGRWISRGLFSVETDMGFAEIFQYLKEYWIAILLLLLALKRKHFLYFAWSVLFTYLLLDDSMELHEEFGRKLVKYLDLKPMFYLRAQDFGELLIILMAGLLLFAFIGVVYLFSTQQEKHISKNLFFFILCLAFFGVFVDLLHIAIPWGQSIWGLIEDGGEMLTMSFIVWYVFGLENTRQTLKKADELPADLQSR